jgi:hypothetical protein
VIVDGVHNPVVAVVVAVAVGKDLVVLEVLHIGVAVVVAAEVVQVVSMYLIQVAVVKQE